MKYSNFRINIEVGDADRYTVKVISDSHGEDATEIQIDPSSPGISEPSQKISKRRTDRQLLTSFGSELYRALFIAGVQENFLLSFGEVDDPQKNEGLRLQLQITPPELAVLPWELLYFDRNQAFFGTQIKSPLVRYLEFSGYRRKLGTPFPLRILVIIPKGTRSELAVDADSEKAVIEGALEGMGEKVEVHYLNEHYPDRRVTKQRIAESLAEREFHCVHFIGHGAFRNDRGYVLLDGVAGEDEFVADEQFAELFTNSPSVRLVVLNACKGAAMSSSQSLTGSAARLVRHGVPAVVAMQFAVYDKAAVQFARSFYHSLFQSNDKGRVDVAVARGRHSLSVEYPNQRELAAPVLFLHTADGMLFVPESGSTIGDLPKNEDQIHTLEEAEKATDDVSEAARFRRRITIAKRSAQLGLMVAMLAFFLSWIRVLDIFTIDTRAEFMVMALGNGIAEHQLSDTLRVITIDANKLKDANGKIAPATMRKAVAQVIENLAAAGAGVIALDFNYSADNGDFLYDPASGSELVELIERVDTPVVVAAKAATGSQLQTPDSLRQAVAGLGHACFESKLGLARSLPISVSGATGRYPSLALTAYAVFRGGNILADSELPVSDVVIAFPDQASIQFAVSEINQAEVSKLCPLIRDGDQVSHRFIKRIPESQLARVTRTATELNQALATDSAGVREDLTNKLVLVGALGADDIIKDLSGNRDGVLWHADAFNNLLLDEAIVPLRDSIQLIIMIALAVVGAALRLQFLNRKRLGMIILLALSAAVLLLAVYTYGRHQILINPAYHILALWFAWWLAGRAGKTWIS